MSFAPPQFLLGVEQTSGKRLHQVNKGDLRPELMGLSPQKASAAESAALVAQQVRRGSVSVASAKNKARAHRGAPGPGRRSRPLPAAPSERRSASVWRFRSRSSASETRER